MITLVTAKFPSLAGDVDEQENTWVFNHGIGDVDPALITPLLNTFYVTNLGNFFGRELSGSAAGTYSYYDITAFLNGSPHGAPFHMDSAGPLNPSSDDALPGQIAIVADFHADLSGISEFGPHTRPRARRRGRHYHGPVKLTSLQWDATTRIPFFSGAFVGELQSAYSALLAGVPTGYEWCVWSRKDAAVYPIVGGWVDTTPHRARHREEPTNVKAFWS